jgi:membrane protease YdiL (CAAX protease family)
MGGDAAAKPTIGSEAAGQASGSANAGETLLVFIVAFVIVGVGWALVGDGALARQAVVWVANVAMLVTIWLCLRARGQGWEHLGLSLRFGGPAALLKAVLLSVVVVVPALVAFVAGGMLMYGVAATPESADMSGYEYMQGNLPMLLLALAAVWVVSSFGEEVVYRGFLMTRLAEIGNRTKLAWGAALAVSAVVFGLAHFAWGVVGIVQTTFMGLALGAAYLLVKRNLWVLVLAHAYVDTLLLVQMYLGPGASGS